MKIEGTTKQDRLSFFRELYEDAKSNMEDAYDDLERHWKQYLGDKGIDGNGEGIPENASYVRNVTYELIESQVTGYIPTPAVSPRMQSEQNERNAKSTEVLLRNLRNLLPFEKMNDLDERYSPIYGGSVWLVEWDNSIVTHNTVGDVRVTCLSPTKFIGQPNIYEIQDMEYCFIRFETTKEDIVRRYGVLPKVAEDTESEENAQDENTATLYVCYYKNDEDKICQFVWSGDTVLLDMDDYYARKREICSVCGNRRELCTCEKKSEQNYELQSEEYEELDRDIPRLNGTPIPAMSEVIRDGQVVMETETHELVNQMTGELLLDENGMPIPISVPVPKYEATKLPFYHPERFPIVVRKNTSQEDSLFGQSDCAFLRPTQQAINKVESRILQKLMRSSVTPLIPEDSEIKVDNEIFGTVIRLKPGFERNSYGVLDTQPNIAQDVAEADRLYEQAKRLIGISDSFQGQHDASAQSGRAKQLQIQQAAGRLDSKRRMKNAAYAEIDEIIFQLYLAYADEPRPVSYKDAFGKLQNIQFNRYDFIERDEAGAYYYNDEYLFSADATVELESSREEMWRVNLENLQSGTLGDPADPQTMLRYWMAQETVHYPHAHDNVEYFKEKVEELRRQQEMLAAQQMQDPAVPGTVPDAPMHRTGGMM